MTTQDTENQAGGADTTGADVGQDTIVGTVAGDQVGVDGNGNDVTVKDGEEVIISKAETAESVHAALATVAADFKKLGLDFEAATKAAWDSVNQ